MAWKHGIRQQLNTTVISCTLHRRETHWRVAQGAVRQVVYNYTEKAYTVLRQKRNSQKLVRLFIISIFECHQDERL